jgi:hypothetical protein
MPHQIMNFPMPSRFITHLFYLFYYVFFEDFTRACITAPSVNFSLVVTPPLNQCVEEHVDYELSLF